MQLRDPNEQPSLVLKPSLNFFFMLILSFKYGFFVLVMISALGFGAIINIAQAIGLNFFASLIITVILMLIATAFLIVGFTWLTLSKTEYRFFKDRVEYYEGFWNQNKHSVLYNRVTDLGQTNSIFERIFGLGSIQLRTGAGMSSVTIKHIKEPDSTYQRLASLMTSAPQQPYAQQNMQQQIQQPNQQQINQ